MALVKRLLSAGADPNRANMVGDTAISIATSAKGRNGSNGLLNLFNKVTCKKANAERNNDKTAPQPRKRMKLLNHLDETAW